MVDLMHRWWCLLPFTLQIPIPPHSNKRKPNTPSNQTPKSLLSFQNPVHLLKLLESTGWSGRLLSRRRQRWRVPRATVPLDIDSLCFSRFLGHFLSWWCICWLFRLQRASFVLVPFLCFYFICGWCFHWTDQDCKRATRTSASNY